ncbi:MAG: sugar transporter [Thalassobium sp.]|nr:MAG: sugar transporter [Thalassobium sp.]
MRIYGMLLLVATLSGCGSAYISPEVSQTDADVPVRVASMTAQSVLIANRATAYAPRQLPAAFDQTAGFGSGLRGAGAIPDTVFEQQNRPTTLETRVPPAVQPIPYTIGVGDVLVLATPSGRSTVEELSGLLAAQNRRQGYTVQDDGQIAIPDVGRIAVAGLSLEEAESVVFGALVENQIEPSFSLEVAEFNSKRVSIGGAVRTPAVVPIRLTPLYLEEALAQAGGITAEDQDFVSIRIYRDGKLYQIPLRELYSNRSLQRIALIDGDSIFVDTEYELARAQAYFEEQIQVAEFRQNARRQALAELESEIAIRRGALNERRQNFRDRVDLGAVQRDYVYLSGEVGQQGRYPLPFETRATLADALFENEGIPTETANVSQIYVLRASADPRDFNAVTAWHLDGSNAVNMILATQFELRPNDVIFVAEQPITRWGRVIQQFTPSLITAGAAATR